MDKRYQVFVSSTYSDLKDERQAVMQALMEMDCIPAGMELFPAADEEQWTFIQKVIDDSDYYVLVLGGRYGTISPEGIGYTEQEFDYAVSKGIKVVALGHGAIEKLPFEKVEATPETRDRLTAFRDKVCTGRLVKFWTEASELPGLVALSLQRTIKMYPAQGWVRANQIASVESLQEAARLQKRVNELEAQLLAQSSTQQEFPENLASGDDVADITLHWTVRNSTYRRDEKNEKVLTVTWNEIFDALGPEVMSPVTEGNARVSFSENIAERYKVVSYARVGSDEFFSIAQHLSALGLIYHQSLKTTDNSHATFIGLTDRGKQYLRKLRTISKSTAKQSASEIN